MSLRIATNLASEKVQRNLKTVTQKQTKELERLSSGKRIINSADDAAGLAISTNLEAQVRGLRQATRNANDGISFVQVAEGALTEVSNMLIRLRELSVQSASDTVGETEREFLNMEYEALVTEVDRIAQSTQFNGTSLLDGEAERGVLEFHVGTFGGDVHKISYDPSETNASADNLGIEGLNVIDKDAANESIEAVDLAIENISGQRAKLGALQSRLKSTVNNLEVQSITTDEARSVIQDSDIAGSAASLAAKNIIKNAAISTLSQANNMPNAALRLIP